VHAAARPGFLDVATPFAIVHRGGAGYPPNVGIENTVRAFAAAITLGHRYLETDVRASRDGVAVVVHDAGLDRLCGVPVRVADATWHQLSELRVGGREPLPRLDALLAEFPDARFTIDLKDDPAVEPALAAIADVAAQDRVCLATFSDRRMRRIRRLAGPDVVTSCSRGEVVALRLGPTRRVRALAARGGAVCAQVPWRNRGVTVTTAALVRHAHELGLQAHVWVVDEAARMHALLDLGVDALITDRPDLVPDVLRSRREQR